MHVYHYVVHELIRVFCTQYLHVQTMKRSCLLIPT